MPAQDAATLKSYFERGDKPTEAQFADLIDSIFSPVVGAGGVIVEETLADLRLVTVPTTARLAFMLGDTAPGDGGGHIYLWNATSVDADDGISTIKSANATGRWKQFI